MKGKISRLALAAAALLLALTGPAPAVLIVRLSDLRIPPAPPNPIKVFGRVISTAPLVIRDGKWQAEIVGLEADLGQMLVVQGDWDGEKLTATEALVLQRTFRTVLNVGNSITYHPPISYFGWTGNWGMDASAEDQDMVHLVREQIRQAHPENALSAYHSYNAGQTGGRLADALAKIEPLKAYQPELVMVQMGENDSYTPMESFIAQYAQLLDEFLTLRPRPRIFCWGVWNSSSAYGPADIPFLQEQAIRSLCDARGIPFRSLRDLATDPPNHDPGGGFVNWHPNDAGMQGYADLFWDALGAEIEGRTIIAGF